MPAAAFRDSSRQPPGFCVSVHVRLTRETPDAVLTTHALLGSLLQTDASCGLEA